MEFVVVNARWVFSAHVAHIDAKAVELQAKEWVKEYSTWRKYIIYTSLVFLQPKWRAISCQHALLVRRSACSSG